MIAPRRRTIRALTAAILLGSLAVQNARGQDGEAAAVETSSESDDPAGSEVETPLDARLKYEIAGGVYVDIGTDHGLIRGEIGWIESHGARLAQVEILSAARKSAFLRFVSGRPEHLPRNGSRVQLIFANVAEPVTAEAERELSATLRKDRTLAPEDFTPVTDSPDINAPTIGEGAAPGGGEEPDSDDAPSDAPGFVPLLAPLDMGSLAETDAINLFHGRIDVRQVIQFASENDYARSLTRVRSSGTLERIDATPWTLEWAGDLSYRAGQGYENVNDFEEPRLEVFQLSLFRRFDDRSFVRLGRFLPGELPSVGFLDGAQYEEVLTDNLRVGGMFGFKPTRENLNVSFEELELVPYLTAEIGDYDSWIHYSGTAGLLASYYEGQVDRLAFLWDQRVDFRRLSISSSSELDFDAGGFESREGVRVTRWNLHASYRMVEWLRLRLGLDRWEKVDTEAERDEINFVVALNEEEFFDRGFWRYWAGARLALPADLTLDGEVSVTDSEYEEDFGVRGQLSLTRRGLPWLPNGSVTLTVYNLENPFFDGYGGRLSAYLPILRHRIFLQPSIGFRMADDQIGNDTLDVADAALRAQWTISDAWSLSGGVSYVHTEEVSSFLLDVGVSFRW